MGNCCLKPWNPVPVIPNGISPSQVSPKSPISNDTSILINIQTPLHLHSNHRSSEAKIITRIRHHRASSMPHISKDLNLHHTPDVSSVHERHHNFKQSREHSASHSHKVEYNSWISKNKQDVVDVTSISATHQRTRHVKHTRNASRSSNGTAVSQLLASGGIPGLKGRNVMSVEEMEFITRQGGVVWMDKDFYENHRYEMYEHYSHGTDYLTVSHLTLLAHDIYTAFGLSLRKQIANSMPHLTVRRLQLQVDKDLPFLLPGKDRHTTIINLVTLIRKHMKMEHETKISPTRFILQWPSLWDLIFIKTFKKSTM